jgi:hypothetical protein
MTQESYRGLRITIHTQQLVEKIEIAVTATTQRTREANALAVRGKTAA